MAATAAALVQLVSTAVETAIARGCDPDRTLDTAATAMARLTPEMLLGVLAAGQSEGPDSAVAASVIGRMTDDTIASFVANSVAVDRGATERLAHAFEALVPELQRKEQLLELAQDKARATELGKDASFDNLWQTAADMLTSYSDKKYVSDDYGRELSGARTRAVEVERVADDPPERVRQWLDTISETALTQLEVQLLLDILRIEDEPTSWAPLAAIAAAEIEHRTRLGALDAAASLVSAIVREQQPDGRPQLATAASQIAETLSSGSLIRHLAVQLRTADEHGVALVAQMCHALGAAAVRPLAEALAHEDNSRAIRALRDILLGFGAVGRNCVEQLKTSTNPAVRRTAIDLLRVFGGDNALSELAAMLDDSDQQVQREAVRAVVQIGTDAAYAVLRPRLVASGASRDVLVQLLISLRDDKVIPPLCHVLANTTPSGALAGTHLQIIEALGALHAHPESTRTLQAVLHRGSWWAPARTATLRDAAAAALAAHRLDRYGGGARRGFSHRRARGSTDRPRQPGIGGRDAIGSVHERVATLQDRRGDRPPIGRRPARRAALCARSSDRQAECRRARRDHRCRHRRQSHCHDRDRRRRPRGRRCAGAARGRHDGRTHAPPATGGHRADRHRGGRRTPRDHQLRPVRRAHRPRHGVPDTAPAAYPRR